MAKLHCEQYNLIKLVGKKLDWLPNPAFKSLDYEMCKFACKPLAYSQPKGGKETLIIPFTGQSIISKDLRGGLLAIFSHSV